MITALNKEAAKRAVNLEVVALGGPRMKAAGAELIAETSSIGAIGLWAALPLVLPTLLLQHRSFSPLKCSFARIAAILHIGESEINTRPGGFFGKFIYFLHFLKCYISMLINGVFG